MARPNCVNELVKAFALTHSPWLQWQRWRHSFIKGLKLNMVGEPFSQQFLFAEFCYSFIARVSTWIVFNVQRSKEFILFVDISITDLFSYKAQVLRIEKYHLSCNTVSRFRTQSINHCITTSFIVSFKMFAISSKNVLSRKWLKIIFRRAYKPHIIKTSSVIWKFLIE